MSGRIVYRKERTVVCDVTGNHSTVQALLSSFWSQHAHQPIEIEWFSWDSPTGDYTLYVVKDQGKAHRLREVRVGLGYRCTPVRYKAEHKAYTFNEMGD